jgi:hypothetical protein
VKGGYALLLVEHGTGRVLGELENHGSHNGETSLGSFDGLVVRSRMKFSLDQNSPEQRYKASTSTSP